MEASIDIDTIRTCANALRRVIGATVSSDIQRQWRRILLGPTPCDGHAKVTRLAIALAGVRGDVNAASGWYLLADWRINTHRAGTRLLDMSLGRRVGTFSVLCANDAAGRAN